MKKPYILPRTKVLYLHTHHLLAGSISEDGNSLNYDNPKTNGDAGSFAASRRKTVWDEGE